MPEPGGGQPFKACFVTFGVVALFGFGWGAAPSKKRVFCFKGWGTRVFIEVFFLKMGVSNTT